MHNTHMMPDKTPTIFAQGGGGGQLGSEQSHVVCPGTIIRSVTAVAFSKPGELRTADRSADGAERRCATSSAPTEQLLKLRLNRTSAGGRGACSRRRRLAGGGEALGGGGGETAIAETL